MVFHPCKLNMGRPKTKAFSGMHLVPVTITIGLYRLKLLGVLCLIGGWKLWDFLDFEYTQLESKRGHTSFGVPDLRGHHISKTPFGACHIRTFPVQIKNYFVRFEVFIAVTMKNGVFWDVTPCASCKNRHSRGT
jgi:hypothetical protein